MAEALRYVKYFFALYFGHSNILYIYLISLIVLCLCGKDKRKIIVYPSLLLIFVIGNPILYKYIWTKLIGGTYWRMLWMIPVVATIGCALISAIDKINNRIDNSLCKNITKIASVIILFAIIVGTNKNVYKRDNFFPVNNMYKVPDSTVIVCKTLIEAEAGGEVKVIMPASIYCYARQYDYRIHQMYGRDVEHYMAYYLLTEEKKKVASEMLSGNPDMSFVTEVAKRDGYKYIVCEKSSTVDNIDMESHGYKLYRQLDDYLIYCAD